MNKLLLSTLLAGAAALPAFAGIDNLNYQAVIRDNNEAVAGKEVGLKFQFVNNGEVIYTEEAFVKTSEQGLAKWLIGTNNTLENVDWSNPAIKLQVSVDLGNGYVALSDAEISSVPTALYALKSADTEQIYIDIEDIRGNVTDITTEVETLILDNDNTKETILGINAEIARIDDFAEKIEELNTEVETLVQEGENTKQTLLGLSGEIARVDGFIEEQDAYNQATTDALAKLVGLDAEEIGDFNERISAEVARLAEGQEETNKEVEALVQEGENTKLTLMGISAEIARVDGFIEEQDAYNQSTSEALAKLVGLDAEEIGDFNERISAEVARLAETQEQMTTDIDDLIGTDLRINTELNALVGEVKENQEAYQEDFQKMTESYDGLSTQVNELTTAVEALVQEDDNTKETILGINAELARVDGFIEEQDAYNQSTSEALAKLVGLDAEEIGDFNERISAEVARLAETQEQMTTDIDDLIGTDLRINTELNALVGEVKENQEAYQEDFQKMTESYDGLSTQVNELTTAVEALVQEDDNTKETILGINAELARVDGFIEEQDAYNQATTDALAKLVGLDAEEIGDFNERVSAELARLAETQSEITTEVETLVQDNDNTKQTLMGISADIARVDGFIEDQEAYNQATNDALAKLVGLDAEEIGDFNERVSAELARLAETQSEITTEVETLVQDNDNTKQTLMGISADIARVDGFIEDQEAYNQATNDALAKLVGLDAEEIGDFNERVSAELSRLAETQTEITTEVEKLVQDNEETQTTVRNMSADIARIDDLSEKVETYQEDFQNMVNTFDGMSTQVNDLTTEVEKLVQDNEETQTTVRNMSADIARIDDLSEKIETYQEDFQNMVNTFDGMSTAFNELKADYEENFQKMTETNDGISTAVNELVGEVADINEKLQNLQGMQAEIARIDGLAEEIENNKADYQEDFQNMVNIFDQISTAVNELKTTVEALQKKVDELENK